MILYHKKQDYVLLSLILVFVADCVVNFFSAAPVFVAFIPIFLFWISFYLRRSDFIVLLIITAYFLGSYFLKSILYINFDFKDLADILFLLLFFYSVPFFSSKPPSLNCVSSCLVVLLFLFFPSIFGFDSISGGAVEEGGVSDDLEFYRNYNSGFFRLAHTASYMMLLSAIWFYFCRPKQVMGIKISWKAVCAISFIFMMFTGSRTAPVAIFLGVGLSYFFSSLKGWLVGFVLSAALVLSVIYIDQLLFYFEGSYFFQYLSFIKTLIENPHRLSRVIIWTSWVDAVGAFRWFDFIYGLSLTESMAHNYQKIGIPVWFHNDFFGVFYAYGFTGLIFFCWYLFELCRTGVRCGRSFACVFIAFVLFAAFSNGFYKYLPFMFSAAVAAFNSSKGNLKSHV
jgi:hypothetical protein